MGTAIQIIVFSIPVMIFLLGYALGILRERKVYTEAEKMFLDKLIIERKANLELEHQVRDLAEELVP